jgi:CcmD family protein
MSNASWLIVALVIVGLAIGGYVWTLTARRQRLARRLDELRAGRPRD